MPRGSYPYNRKRAEQRQQIMTDLYSTLTGKPSSDRKTEERMSLDQIAAAYASPAAAEKFARETMHSLHGSVRIGFMQSAGAVVLIGAVIGLLVSLCSRAPGIVTMLVLVPALVAAFVLVWYLFSWEVTFDGESGWMSYHTLFQGTARFHVSEIQYMQVKPQRFKPYAILEKADVMEITVNGETIPVILRKYILTPRNVRENFSGGCANAGKLFQYLDLYEKYIAGSWKQTAAETEEPLSPAVKAAIEAAKREAAAKAEAPTVFEEITPAEVEKAVAGGISEPPVTSPLPFPEEQAPIPEKAAAVMRKEEPVHQPKNPEELPKKKEGYVDVDALFDKVLKDYGKK